MTQHDSNPLVAEDQPTVGDNDPTLLPLASRTDDDATVPPRNHDASDAEKLHDTDDAYKVADTAEPAIVPHADIEKMVTTFTFVLEEANGHPVVP